tara:strand:+ start:352 stop:531 length:180 start_codon:yes stop_codon:yes gene_type:complete
MPSKKQLAWRKKFAMKAKRGDFKKAKAKSAKAKKKKSTPMKKGSALKHSDGYDSKEWRS